MCVCVRERKIDTDDDDVAHPRYFTSSSSWCSNTSKPYLCAVLFCALLLHCYYYANDWQIESFYPRSFLSTTYVCMYVFINSGSGTWYFDSCSSPCDQHAVFTFVCTAFTIIVYPHHIPHINIQMTCFVGPDVCTQQRASGCMLNNPPELNWLIRTAHLPLSTRVDPKCKVCTYMGENAFCGKKDWT